MREIFSFQIFKNDIKGPPFCSRSVGNCKTGCNLMLLLFHSSSLLFPLPWLEESSEWHRSISCHTTFPMFMVKWYMFRLTRQKICKVVTFLHAGEEILATTKATGPQQMIQSPTDTGGPRLPNSDQNFRISPIIYMLWLKIAAKWYLSCSFNQPPWGDPLTLRLKSATRCYQKLVVLDCLVANFGNIAR